MSCTGKVVCNFENQTNQGVLVCACGKGCWVVLVGLPQRTALLGVKEMLEGELQI
jgi:hypothetical protein